MSDVTEVVLLLSLQDGSIALALSLMGYGVHYSYAKRN